MSNEERKKNLGSFATERGSVGVFIVYEEIPVRTKSDGVVRVVLPTFIEFLAGNTGEIRIKVEDLDGFVGLMGGHAREVRRARLAALRDLDRLGVQLSGR